MNIRYFGCNEIMNCMTIHNSNIIQPCLMELKKKKNKEKKH